MPPGIMHHRGSFRYRGTMTAPLRHAGLLAHTAEGAALCYLEFCRAAPPNEAHPDITLDHIAFARSAAAWDARDYASINKLLGLSIERLKRAGADFFFCPANTAHIALEAPSPELALPGLHIVEVVADEALRNGWRKIGVLATRFTAASGLYPRILAARGIDTIIPEAEDQDAVHDLIMKDLVPGRFTDAGRDLCRRIIGKLADEGCDAVAMACTEIPLLLAGDDSALPLIDSTRLLAKSAHAVASGAAPLPSWRGGPNARALEE